MFFNFTNGLVRGSLLLLFEIWKYRLFLDLRIRYKENEYFPHSRVFTRCNRTHSLLYSYTYAQDWWVIPKVKSQKFMVKNLNHNFDTTPSYWSS